MPNINLDNVKAIDVTADYKRLSPGGYVVKIVDIQPEDEHQRFWIVFDIAEGDDAGFYASEYGIKNPWTHRVLVSYKDTALGVLKGRFNLLASCNPGFDPEAAFRADAWDLFNGKLFGLIVGAEEYESNTGETRERLDWFNAKWRNVETIRNGSFRIPETKKKDRAIAVPQVTEHTAVYDDIPFD